MQCLICVEFQIAGLLKDNEKIQSNPEVPPSDDDTEIKKIKKVRSDTTFVQCSFKGESQSLYFLYQSTEEAACSLLIKLKSFGKPVNLKLRKLR